MIQRFRKRRPEDVFVEAIQVTQKNGSEVEAWCGGESYDVGMAPGLTHHVDVPVAGVDPAVSDRRTRANVGNFVVKSNGSFFVLSAEGFEHFEPAGDEGSAGKTITGTELRSYCEGAITRADGIRRTCSSEGAYDLADGAIAALNDLLRDFDLLDAPSEASK